MTPAESANKTEPAPRKTSDIRMSEARKIIDLAICLHGNWYEGACQSCADMDEERIDASHGTSKEWSATIERWHVHLVADWIK